jgi:GTP-binding protein YchF
MKIAIAGFTNSGKTTLFNALTGQKIETHPYPTLAGEPHLGMVSVPDGRVARLSGIYKPKKTTYATVEYIDYLGLTKGDPKQNAKVFGMMKDADALLHVVRAFEDPAVPHTFEGIDPLRDMSYLEQELILGDLELVEKRLERMEEGKRKGKKPNEAERAVLLKCKEALENEIPLREVEFSEDELKDIRHLEFISIKPEVVAFNISEDYLKEKKNETGDLIARAGEKLGGNTEVVAVSGKIEMELSQLAPEEAGAFLQDLGIEEPARDKLIRTCYRLLVLISFFTVGEDEVKAWTIKNGTSALKAAGKIHSDIEKGFIRAEVVHYDDFINTGGMAEARNKGLLRLEGKTYIVKDGDIINFRFAL